MNQSDAYAAVDYIKTVVKQLTSSLAHCPGDRQAAGALTNSIVEVAKKICDEAATADSTLVESNIKPDGWSYTRSLTSEKKYKVIRSTRSESRSEDRGGRSQDGGLVWRSVVPGGGRWRSVEVEMTDVRGV